MKTYIFSKKEAAVKASLPGKKESEAAEFKSVAALGRHSPEAGDLSYLDVSGFTAADLKKAVTALKKRCKGAPWGIVDPKGMCKDPAPWFFEGAADYLGPGALGQAGAKRFQAAAEWKLASGGLPKKNEAGASKSFGEKIKLNTGRFAGWKAVESGSNVNVYLLYAALRGKTLLQSRLSEAGYNQLYKKTISYLMRNLQSAEALPWIDSGKDCLFIIPPRESHANAAVTSCLSMLISAPLTTIETLNLSVPANFVFALHYGAITYRPPGKTGTLVSDAVNFIFHLGASKAESGLLTISGETPDVTIPHRLKDFFMGEGAFEGRSLVKSRRFSYLKPWV
ncbi:MAG: hypothetical protein LBJ31_10615 [Treponema sp.]|jgi:hypothetical protein|nr:hypothetical protein [Treponema sp.]